MALTSLIDRFYVSSKNNSQERAERRSNWYTQLKTEDHEIRLVEILPGKEFDQIKCRFRHISLKSDCDPFDALSYTWGSPRKRHEILLQDKPFLVRQNLAIALQKLRQTNVSRFMWIDAISINQGDVTERSEQVAIMRHIYQSAKNVVIWLGDTAENSDLAFDFMSNIAGQPAQIMYLSGMSAVISGIVWGF